MGAESAMGMTAKTMRWILAAAVLCGAAAQAQVAPMMQVPMTSLYAGMTSTTYNGTTANGSVCAAALDTLGDGCPATQAQMTYTYGVAFDSNYNLFVAEYQNNGVRVVYRGGTAFTAALVAGESPKYPALTAPVAGYMYQIGGNSALTSHSGIYYCNGTSGLTALDSLGDGCPSAYADMKPRNVTTDKYGNVWVTDATTNHQGVRIFYVGGSSVASQIMAYNPAITSVQPGYVYRLGADGDFIAIRDVAVDTNGNIYVSDNGAITAETGLQATTSGNQIKKFNGAGWATYITGAATAAPTSADGDGGAATAASITNPTMLQFDANNNLFIADVGNARLRVVYSAGTTAPLYVEGNNATVVTSPVAGNIYTVAGGGTLKTTGSLASTVLFAPGTNGYLSLGVDAAGNILVMDGSFYIWRVDAATGIATLIGGYGASTTTYTANATPAAGATCNGVVGGPVMTDADGEGCPATEVLAYGGWGRYIFDATGNFYYTEHRTSTAPVSIVRKYSYLGLFAAQAVKTTSASAAVAYTPSTVTTYTPTENFLLTGAAATDYADAGGGLCSIYATTGVQTCVYNVSFTPQTAGARLGALTLTASGSTLATTLLGGVGTGAALTIDPATQSAIGTGFSPTGVGEDESGNTYIADGTSGKVYKSAGGATPAVYASGFKNAEGIAVNGAGVLYVADTGNNRLAAVSLTGVVTSVLTTFGGVALSGPSGVAAAAAGDVFVSDTGNNRVLEIAANGMVSALGVAGLKAPMGLTLDAAGDLFVADAGNARVVEYSAAGAQTAITLTPALATPVAVAVDAAGDLFVADNANQNVVEAQAGTTTATPLVGSVMGLDGLAADPGGNLYVTATGLTGAMKLNRTTVRYAFGITGIGFPSSQTFTLTDAGNSTLTLGSPVLTGSDTTNYTLTAATTNGCSLNQVLAVGGNCAMNAQFNPLTAASFTDNVTAATTPTNSDTLTLTGTGKVLVGTTTALSYSVSTGGNPLAAFTATATINVVTNVGAATGTVAFYVDGLAAGTATVSSNAASVNLKLTVGPHSIKAVYGGDTNYAPSSTTQIWPAGTSSVSLAVTTTGTITYGQAVAVTATTTTGNSAATATGTVAFSVDGVVQKTLTYAASLSTTVNVPAGTHTLAAVYSGDMNYQAGTGTASVTLNKAQPAITLMLTPTAGPTSNTVAMSATVGSSISTPTGTVTFTNGTTTLGTGTLNASGVATYNSTNQTPAATITATYGGDSNFLVANVTVTPTATFLISNFSPSTLQMAQNGVGQASLQVNSFYNYAGTLTINCTNAPSYVVCRGMPQFATLTANGTAGVVVQVYTSIPPVSAANRGLKGLSRQGMMTAALCMLLLPLARRRGLRLLVMLVVALAVAVGAVGCGTGVSDTNNDITPTGTYAVTLNVTDGSQTTSQNLSLVVLPATSVR